MDAAEHSTAAHAQQDKPAVAEFAQTHASLKVIPFFVIVIVLIVVVFLVLIIVVFLEL